MKCNGYLISNTIDLSRIVSLKKLREVAYIVIDSNEYFIFPYGVVICWGDGELSTVYHVIQDYLKHRVPLEQVDKDEFEVKLGSEKVYVFEDTIHLDNTDPLIKLTLSHAIAQNLRLSQIEMMTLERIKAIKHIPTDLAEKGKIAYSKKEISKLLGTIYVLKSKMSFEYSVLDKPEFFWEYPEYDELYRRMADYLELAQRLDILQKKIETINEILSLLTDELNHRHSSTLEWIIIILILIEIVIFFVQDVFHLI
tara:strand:+ start:316496 stop:317257 length:762 start_codon:yes stop_codon:yes gene_type:complete